MCFLIYIEIPHSLKPCRAEKHSKEREASPTSYLLLLELLDEHL